MNIDDLVVEIEKFIVFTTESQPGPSVLALLVAVAAVAWIGTDVARRMISLAVVLARAVMVALTGLSTVVVACLVFAFLALTG